MARKKQQPKPKLPQRAKDFNADRIRARRENQQKQIEHSKDMAQRMGVAPAKRENVEDGERLHVRIAHAGVCSRRAAERLIMEGRVTVDGEIVMDMGVKVSPTQQVRVDGQPIATPNTYTVVLYKPLGVVTTMSDPQGRPTIVRYLPDYGAPLKPVGRLDMDTEGLLICTNDGELAHRLAHPRYGIEKEYQALVKGIPEEKALKDLRKGVFIEGRRTAPAKVEVIHSEPKANTTSLRITIHEGRKRQVRMMCDAIGHPIVSLKRFRIGPLFLKGLRPGEAKLLGQKEVNQLREIVGLEPR